MVKICLCFLLRVLICSFYIKIFDELWVNFCIWCGIRVKFYFLACEYHFPSTTCWKDCFSPSWMILAPLLKTIWPEMCIGFFLDSQFCSLIYISSLMAVPHYLDYCSFVVSFEIGNCESANFVFFDSRLLWLVRIPCNSIWILGSAFHFYNNKNPPDFQ